MMESGDQPDEISVGIGIGYVFPTSVETPNAASAKVRLPNGVEIGPRVIATSSSDKTDDGMGNTSTQKLSEIGITAAAWIPVVHHGKFELYLVGAAGFDKQTTSPPTPDNDKTVTTIDIAWGVGIGYWITRHWELSLDASNPLFTSTKTEQQNGPGMTMSETVSTFGLVFDPTISLFIHLWH